MSADKLSENKWLLSCTEVLLQVELGETLSANLESSSFVGGQVSSTNKSITIDSLSLMDPKFN